MLAPCQESFRKIRVERNRFLRCFGLARPNYLENYRSGDADFVREKVDVAPLEGKEFTHPQTGAEVEQYESSFAEGETSNQLTHFACTQHGWDLHPFCALPH
jgi:hypothetical protein